VLWLPAAGVSADAQFFCLSVCLSISLRSLCWRCCPSLERITNVISFFPERTALFGELLVARGSGRWKYSFCVSQAGVQLFLGISAISWCEIWKGICSMQTAVRAAGSKAVRSRRVSEDSLLCQGFVHKMTNSRVPEKAHSCMAP
jgi:hypothetical protein